MPAGCKIYVSPKTIPNLKAYSGSTLQLDDFTVSGDYLYSVWYSSGGDLTFKADGYEDLTQTIVVGSNYITMIPAVPNYVSNLSDGTNTYIIKDANAVKSVNSVSPDSSGNVSLTIPDTSNLADKDLSNLSTTGNQRILWYGTCSTSASTQTKDVTCSGFTLATGASIRVYFQNQQAYGGTPKLNVNGTGAKSVYVYSAGAAQKYEWRNGAILDFTYNGTYWIMVRGSHATTTYYGVTVLTDTVDTTTDKALSPNGAYLALQGKQDALVSGTNIKTINNTTILGSGNISIKINDLFDFKWTDYLLNDQNWLRADTYSWQDGTVYSDAYNHLVDDIDGKTATTETIGSYTISYYLADDGHKITTDEATVLSIYNESGVAWYYVLDTTNQRFKLPRTKYGFAGLRDAVGKYIPETLPNVTGTMGKFSPRTTNNITYSGAFVYEEDGDYNVNTSGTSVPLAKASFDASRVSSTYQDSAPVQQRATQMYLYFYVGQFSQSATEQTAGLNAELFNGKVDLNLDNMNPSQTAKQTIAGWSTDSISKNSNGYVKFANGIIIQWGRINAQTSGVTLPTPFSSDTSYSVALTGYNNSDSQGNKTQYLKVAPSSTGFTITGTCSPNYWIAIGY